MENLPEIQPILTALTDTSAKHRERAIMELSPAEVQDPRIQDRLQRIVSTDPVEYVRIAARAALVANHITPVPSATEIELRQEGTAKPAYFVIIAIGIIAACVAVTCIAAIAIVITSGWSWS